MHGARRQDTIRTGQDHPQFTFPFRGRHYDIEKGVKKEAVSFDDIYENLKFKYEINRIVKEIINDIS